MKTWTAVSSLVVAVAIFATPVLAQTAPAKDTDRKKVDRAQDKPKAPGKTPSSTQTGGTTKPSAVDPAQADKTGANVGEGASYSRSTEKGDSVVKDGEARK